MKKTYIKPSTVIVTIATTQMMAASNPNEQKAIVNEEEVTTGYVDSRSYDVWADDEEEY